MSKDIILFPGSFSPLHVGHLCLANYIVETIRTDELWFVLTPSNPFKDPRELLPEEFRAEWVREVIKFHPKLKLSTDEFGLPEPNYTIDTLAVLRHRYPECSFRILLGMDSLIDLPSWHRGSELMQDESLLVYPRLGYDAPSWMQEYPKIRFMKEVPMFEVSSTLIREKIRQGLKLPFFLSLPTSHPLYSKLESLLREEK